MHTGLYFGSFNPVHIGHLIVADAMIDQVGMDEVWLVVSPQNPFKESASLAPEDHRLEMARLATQSHDSIQASDVEFHLDKPSYTIDTLKVLHEQYPDRRFSIIMGKDNLVSFKKWKEYKAILERVDIHVYDRRIIARIDTDLLEHEKIAIHDLPLINVSSTRLRKQIKEGRSIRYWVKDEVEAYIRGNDLYSDL